MSARWMRPPELEMERAHPSFDPLRAGTSYGLPDDLLLAIWARVCVDASDGKERIDGKEAERQFHDLAARLGERGGRLRPDVGRLTRAQSELDGVLAETWAARELIPRTPGRDTLVAAEARRRRALHGTAASQVAAKPGTARRSAPPGANDVKQALAALQARTSNAGPARPDPLALDLDIDAAPQPAAALRGRGADPWLLARMQRTFGAAVVDIPITSDSTRPLSAEAEGVAVGEQVYIAPGYYDLTTTAGRERLGHEVAHVLQQRRGRDLPDRLSAGERAGLEAEADRAGHAFARGKPFAVQGRAPAQVPLFKGAKPGAAPAATTTTIDLKAGGRIERKPPAPKPAAGAPATPATDKPSAKEQLRVTYGAIQASDVFTIERNAAGDAVKLVGSGTLALPVSKYMKQLKLKISLGPDGVVVAKLQDNATTTIQIGGLVVRSGQLTAAIDHGQLTYALSGATLALPKNIGEGALNIVGKGDQTPEFDASLAINVPKMQPATMSFHASESGYRAEGSTGIDIKQASGTVAFGLEKVGEDKVLWSAAGSVGYNSERLSGQLSVQYNADGELSGEGTLAFQIADFLTGQATVAVDKEGHVTVNGEIRPPNETQLFPEKKIENTFFRHSVEFPIWGITIPAVGSVGLIAFIEGSLGYRVGVGAGVMRNIVLSGQYSTDPSKQPTFAITGEIFIPAFAELLISVGGGIKLSAFIAEVGGGVKVDGRAGFYGGLSVRPTLAYEGGKYRLTGQALLAGDVGLSAQVDAFVRLHVGKWMFSWEKEWDWKLAEWNKFLGLNLGMQANLDYTLGQPLSPDIFQLKKPDSIDVQDIAKSAMPQGGMPPQGPKGAQNQKTEFTPKGASAAPAAAGPATQPKVAGTPAGAAGHKNQDPKGKNVKPTKPAAPGKPKPAKGKGPNQTGPNPKNKSKPSEQKLDATPIIERFSMHGEPHQLIVQLGPGGHVDMASKRERLSVKVGNAVGKLTAKHASPQQIADLRKIGETAKRGDKMVATAKLGDKPGTTQVAQQIAAYGNKWEVKDLDEVAIKAPRSLTVSKPLRFDKPSSALAKALVSARGGQVIFNKPGDPKQVARQVLEKHKEARFDFASARLTLPSPQAAGLATAASVDQVGQQLAQQLGVSKITIKKTEQAGEIKLELVGEIGGTGTLGTIVVAFKAPSSLVVPKPVRADKLPDAFVKELSGAKGTQVVFDHPGSSPAEAVRLLVEKHKDASFDFATARLTLPSPQAAAITAAQSAHQAGQQLAQQTGVSKVSLEKTEEHGTTKLTFTGQLGASTTLGTATIPTKDTDAWWLKTGHFKTKLESHTLLFVGEGEQAQLHVHSVPRTIDGYVTKLLVVIEEHPQHKSRKADYLRKIGAPISGRSPGNTTTVRGIEQEIYLIKSTVDQHQRTVAVYYGQEKGKRISELLGLLAQLLATLPDANGPTKLPGARPPSQISPRGTHTTPKLGSMTSASRDGTGVDAKLSLDPGGSAGSAASYASPLYKAVKNDRGTEIAPGHLLNHQLHGPGTQAWNIAPIPKESNVAMANGVEAKGKELVLDQHRVVDYHLELVWPTSPESAAPKRGVTPHERALPDLIKWSIRELEFPAEQFPEATEEQLAAAMQVMKNWRPKADYVLPAQTHTPKRFTAPITTNRNETLAYRWRQAKAATPPTIPRDFYRANNLSATEFAEIDALEQTLPR